MNPSFIVIGGMKCGSTSLDYYLKAHPQIAMPKKELDYFSLNYQKGSDWYLSKFPASCKTECIFGETSVSYAKFPHHKDVPARIFTDIPNAKLIYILRDPFKRLVSHYMHNVYADNEKESLENILKSKKESSLYVAFSKYFFQIEQYLKYFDPSRIHILTLEDLSNIELLSAKLNDIFKFLGVKENIVSTEFSQKKQQSEKKGKKGKAALIISKFPYYRKFVDIAPEPLKNLYIRLFTTQLAAPKLNDDTKQRIYDYLSSDTEKLRQFTGRAFESWSI